MGREQFGDTLRRVPAFGGEDGSSTSLATILVCFTASSSIPHAPPFLQKGGGAYEHPTDPFATPGVYTCTSYRGGLTGLEGREGANEVIGEIGVGAGTETGTVSSVGTWT